MPGVDVFAAAGGAGGGGEVEMVGTGGKAAASLGAKAGSWI